MKLVLVAVTLASLTAASWAASEAPGALRAECASERMAKLDATTKEANEYRFVYAQGKYKGEYEPGKALACTDAQYAAFLGKNDPNRLMLENPTAAGAKQVKK